LLCLCRAGFERECAAELADWAAASGADATLEQASGAAYVTANLSSPRPPPAWRELIFTRSAVAVLAHFPLLDQKDRLGPMIEDLRQRADRYAEIWVEAPDSAACAELKSFCRSFEAAAVAALRKHGLLEAGAPRRLHIVFSSFTSAWLAVADPARGAPWPGGIPRLRLPHQAPSRSALKIEEAWLVLMDEDERARWLKPGMSAVDLGAAPGGWSWQLARKGLHVSAVDNGPLKAEALASGLVKHVRADGFRYRPQRPVDWLVCDMVEQPKRIAALIAEWLVAGGARAALFNLKLPMKRRYEETRQCLDGLAASLRAHGKRFDLRARQLYHDREEITVLALPPSSGEPGRRRRPTGRSARP
jgi:23S rRNA (cytidine2498-2'-O)-methyltransferase